MVIESNKKMERKANEKFKPQQPHGCEDLDYRSSTQQSASCLARIASDTT